jgi:transposase
MKQITKLHFERQKFFTGIDVHKNRWVVTIRTNGTELGTFSMNPSPLDLYRHMRRNYPGGEYYSVYEAGFCGYWIHGELQRFGFHNIVVNPLDIPTTHKEKTNKMDSVDSRKLCRELEKGSLRGIYIPDELHQQLRSLCRLRYRVMENLTRVKNRIKSYLHIHGIEIPGRDEMSHWSGYFIQWLDSLEFSHESGRDYLRFCTEELHEHRNRLAFIVCSLRKYCTKYNIHETINYLRTIPGIGFLTAMTFYVEVMDIGRFRTLDHLCSYVGLIPSVKSSGDKKIDRGLTSRRNRYLRYLIIEAAWIAVRKDPALTMAFARLTRRMTRQEAIVRIAKKLLNRIRYVWKNQKPYVKSVIE